MAIPGLGSVLKAIPAADGDGGNGGGGLTTITQVLSNSVNDGATITVPMGVQAGDVIVLFDLAVFFGGGAPEVIPPGFSTIFNALGGSARVICSYKIAAGTEGGTTLTGMEASGGKVNAEGKILVIFRGDVPITTVTVQDATVVVVNGLTDPADQVVNASGGTPPLIVLAGYGADASVDPRSFSPEKDGEVSAAGSDISAWLAWKIYNTSPADVTVGMADEGDFTNVLGSAFLECS